MDRGIVVIDELKLAKVVFDAGFLPVYRPWTLIEEEDGLETVAIVGHTSYCIVIDDYDPHLDVCDLRFSPKPKNKGRRRRDWGSPKFGSGR